MSLLERRSSPWLLPSASQQRATITLSPQPAPTAEGASTGNTKVHLDAKPLNAPVTPVRDGTRGQLLPRAVVWVRGHRGQVLHTQNVSSGFGLPSRAEPRHGAGLSPADQGNRADIDKIFCNRNHILRKHLKETDVLVTLDQNWIQWPSKPLQGLNRALG